MTGATLPTWRQYLELTKPRVVALIVFTAFVGMFLAVPGLPPLRQSVFGFLGIWRAASSAAANAASGGLATASGRTSGYAACCARAVAGPGYAVAAPACARKGKSATNGGGSSTSVVTSFSRGQARAA